MLTTIAAQVDGTPCCTYVGAGRRRPLREDGPQRHRVRRHAAHRRGLRPAAPRRRARGAGDRRDLRATGTTGELESFLIEITARVLGQDRRRDGRAARRRDPRRGRAEGHRPLDGAGRARARRRRSPTSPRRCSPARLSALKDAARARATAALAGPEPADGSRQPSLADDLAHALYASKIVRLRAGLRADGGGVEKEGWDLKLGEMATIWRGGCIIRARFLDRIREAYDDGRRRCTNLMLADFFRDALGRGPGPVAPRRRPLGRARHPDARLLAPRSPTTTATAGRRAPPPSSRACATSSARTPTAASTARARSTSPGPATSPSREA